MVLTEKSLEVLLQLSTIVNRLPEGTYQKPLEVLDGTTIGKHARHILEYFECLFASASTGVVDYDARGRESILETDPRELMGRIAALALVLRTDDFIRTNELVLKAGFASHPEGVLINTSFDRELWYNVEHCVHHLCIIRIAARSIGITDLPEEIGMAFSTQQYKAEQF